VTRPSKPDTPDAPRPRRDALRLAENVSTLLPALPAATKPRLGAGKLIRAIRRRWLVGLGLALVIILLVVALCAPLIAPYSPLKLIGPIAAPPSGRYWLGTDQLGRDELSRIIYGARASLEVAVAASALSLLVGGAIGVLAGYYGGAIDIALMRVVDVFMAFPFIILAILIVAAIGPGTRNVILAIGLTGWTATARILRGETLRIREEGFVDATRSLGASNPRILMSHVVPSLAPMAMTLGSIGIGTAIISEASLSFLGLGLRPPTPDWGLDLSFGREFVFSSPLLTIAPAAAILLAALGFNLLGDGLRDVLDPRANTLVP
jgi:peptide/nickel transport system permease protein